ncbi:RCC1 domain-containing protein [Labilithrix luteola]|nr:RCC1 domain-containing protein [Labilithrix luteola]
MKPRFGILSLVATTSLVSSAMVVACGDDSSDSHTFDFPDAAPDVVDNAPDGGSDASEAGDSAVRRDPFDPTDEPVVCDVDGGPCATQLVAGLNHFCALLSDKTVRCWGDNTYGSLGNGGGRDPGPKLVVEVGKLTGVTQLSAGNRTTCAVVDDGSVRCWGYNGSGQLGISADPPTQDEGDHAVPTPVALSGAAKHVDVGDENACALLTSGELHCWGNDDSFQLANPKTAHVRGPGPASLGSVTVSKVALGTNTTLGLTSTGDVMSWGELAGPTGPLGGRMTSISPDPHPNPILQLHSVTSLAASLTFRTDVSGPLNPGTQDIGPGPRVLRRAHACAIAGGEVYCWGRSDYGALCTGLPDAELLPARAPLDSRAWPQQVAVADEITCVRMTDGTVRCCGGDSRGRLGNGSVDVFTAFFVPVASLTGHAVQIATSNRSVCALLKDGSVQCWGSNEHGELGTDASDEDPHPTPMKIAF